MNVKVMIFVLLTVHIRLSHQCMKYPARRPHSKVLWPHYSNHIHIELEKNQTMTDAESTITTQPNFISYQNAFEGVVKRVRKLAEETHQRSNDDVSQEPKNPTGNVITKIDDQTTTDELRLYFI